VRCGDERNGGRSFKEKKMCQEIRLGTNNLNDRPIDNEVRNCNMIYWLKNEHVKAIRIWRMGKEIAFSFTGEEDAVIGHL